MQKKRRRRSRDGGIELEIDGVVVWVSRGAEAKTVAAVIQAFKAGGGGGVIAPPAGVKVLVATDPIDFRKGANGWRR